MTSRRRTRSSATSQTDFEHVSLDSFSRSTKRSREQTYTVKAERGDLAGIPVDDIKDEAPPTRPLPKKRRRAKGDYADLDSDPLTDRIREGLDVLFCGENPGIRTAETQLHYASPHNHFYKAIHAAGLTPTVLEPSASRTFPEDYNIGITNLIPRPTREASELTKAELEAAVPVFLRKVVAYRPRIVAFIGMKVGDTVAAYFAGLPVGPDDRAATPPPAASIPAAASTRRKPPPAKASIGLQPFAISHGPSIDEGQITYFYVLPSTSGRVAAYPLPVKLGLFRDFGVEVAKLRSCPPLPLDVPASTCFFALGDLGLGVNVVKKEGELELETKSVTETGLKAEHEATSHFKRNWGDKAEEEAAATTPTKKPARPYADPSQYAEDGEDPLPDYLEEGLDEARTQYRSSFHCAARILSEEGVLRFWRGATPRLARLVLSGGIIFTVYEKGKLGRFSCAGSEMARQA
ncbi:hypothetical protein JCM10908_007395 [Rhodotorula pacifica]|uniref:uncharacterized protein n=1 Tax=Rhodotorula pacifica TaxID=1495444 RepID=UPI003179FEC2